MVGHILKLHIVTLYSYVNPYYVFTKIMYAIGVKVITALIIHQPNFENVWRVSRSGRSKPFCRGAVPSKWWRSKPCRRRGAPPTEVHSAQLDQRRWWPQCFMAVCPGRSLDIFAEIPMAPRRLHLAKMLLKCCCYTVIGIFKQQWIAHLSHG